MNARSIAITSVAGTALFLALLVLQQPGTPQLAGERGTTAQTQSAGLIQASGKLPDHAGEVRGASPAPEAGGDFDAESRTTTKHERAMQKLMQLIASLEIATESGDQDRIDRASIDLEAWGTATPERWEMLLDLLLAPDALTRKVFTRLAAILASTPIDEKLSRRLHAGILQIEAGIKERVARDGRASLVESVSGHARRQDVLDALNFFTESWYEDLDVRAALRGLALSSSDEEIRRHALFQLGRSRDASEIDMLLGIARYDTSAAIRAAAVRALAEMPPSAELGDRFAEWLFDDDAPIVVQRFSAHGLSRYAGAPETASLLATAARSHRDRAVRTNALASLAEQAAESRRAQAALVDLLAETSDPQVIRIVSSGLAEGIDMTGGIRALVAARARVRDQPGEDSINAALTRLEQRIRRSSSRQDPAEG